MKCSREKPETFWTGMGRKAAAAGYSLEWAVKPIKPEYTKAIDWVAEGYAKQVLKMAKQARAK